MPGIVSELLVTAAAIEKLGARAISGDEVGQLPRHPHVTVRNPHAGGQPGGRRLLIGATDGGVASRLSSRALSL